MMSLRWAVFYKYVAEVAGKDTKLLSLQKETKMSHSFSYKIKVDSLIE